MIEADATKCAVCGLPWQAGRDMGAEIASLRAALETARLYISDQMIAHALVIPEDADISEGSFPTLLGVINAALNVEQKVREK